MRKRKQKTKEQLAEEVRFLQNRIKKMGRLAFILKHKEKELIEIGKNLDDRVDSRTSAERIVHTLLHKEIEERKQSEHELEKALEYADAIINTIREPLLVLNADLRVISASRSFYQIFNVKQKETENQHIYELGDHQWDIPELRELLGRVLPQATSFENFEVVHNFPGLGMRIMLLNGREIHQDERRTKLILLAIEDVTERKRLEEKLKSLADHDDLTGCLNYRSIMNLLEEEITRGRRYRKEFSIIMTDIDNFKTINDEYGHLAGNDVMVAFSDVLKSSVRAIDTVGRYGGDEFLIVLPETDHPHAIVVMERIKNKLMHATIVSEHAGKKKGFTLRCSSGVATFPHNAKNLKELIWFADNALRLAKQHVSRRAPR